MAYRLEGKSIVIDGFENGIADDPYTGIADIRNANLISVPGEASVNFKTAAMTKPPVVSAVAFSATAATDIITVASTSGFYNGMAITINSLVGGTGLSTGRAYWIGNLTATTFKLYTNPSLNVLTLVNITVDGTGTYSTYTLGKPIDKAIDFQVEGSGQGLHEFILDDNGRVWWAYNPLNTPANALVYLGNDTLTGTTGRAIVVFLNYLIVFRTSAIDALNLGRVESDIDLDSGSGWVYAWETVSTSGLTPRPALAATDNALYYHNTGERLGSILENAGSTFNPSSSATYTKNTDALRILENDSITSLSQLGINLLVGGEQNYIYPWDRISTSYNYPLIIPENYTTRIVSTNSNAYIFAGNRGRIYVTNGSNVDLWKKVPDHITGVVEPYIAWGDTQYWRNQIYFSFIASTNAGVALNNTSGLWAIDLASDAFRLTNQLSYGSYEGTTTVILPNVQSTTPGGAGLLVGWDNSGTYGVDYGLTTPYTNLETRVDSDMIPVGTYLSPYTPSQIEWKTSAPLGGNGTAETIRISYRTNLADAFTLVGTSTATGTTMVGSTTGTTTGAVTISDYYQSDFQKAQWIQLRYEASSNATTPTYNRLKQIRIGNFTEQEQT